MNHYKTSLIGKKKSKKTRNKSRAYASNRNIIKINIHHPKNRRRTKRVEIIKKPIHETVKPNFMNVHVATPSPHREVVSMMQAMKHQEDIKNITQQNNLNQKLLQQLLNANKLNENTTADGTNTPQNLGRTDDVADDDSLEFNDSHLTPVIPTPETPQKLPEERKEEMLTPDNIRDLASRSGLDETEVMRIADFYKIPGEYTEDTEHKINIRTFIKENMRFLYDNGFIVQGDSLPPSKQILKDLKDFYTTNIGNLPRRNNAKRDVNLDQMYRELIDYINKN